MTLKMNHLIKIVNSIGKCVKFEEIHIFHMKYLVLTAINPLLNHKKRLVRQETALTINLWNSI